MIERGKHSLRYVNYRNYDLAVCRTIHEKVACRNLSYEQLQTSDYNLRSLAYVKERLDDVRRHVYISASDKLNQTLVGAFRVEPDLNISQWSNLNSELMEYYSSGHRLVGASAYYVNRVHAFKNLIFEGLVTVLIRYLRETSVDGIYIEVKPSEMENYISIGFIAASDPFSVSGWDTAWQAMFMQLNGAPERYADIEFQNSWRENTGVALKTEFWRRIIERVNSNDGWIS